MNSKIMDSKQCEKCGEMVGTAKAFCPSCGNCFVAEATREKASEFEASAGTVQYSHSMFDQLLSEMDLNISESPNKQEKTSIQPLSPAAPAPASESTSIGSVSGSRKKWLIIGGIALVLAFFALLLVAVVIIVYLNFDRLRPYVG